MPKKRSNEIDLPGRVLDFFRRCKPEIGPGPLLVAVSGGPDSVCLFHVLLGLRETLGIQIHVVHLDHQLRGIDSEADSQYVAGLARQFGIPSSIDSRDVRTYRALEHLSLEEAAREVRYSFFAEVARKNGAAAVAVGHTRDDNIVTILMHLIRGTGTRGLRGLSPVSKWHSLETDLTVIRPLLEISRRETHDYCDSHSLEARTDQTNSSPSLFRNRVRLQLWPVLDTYNSQMGNALLRMAAIASDDFEFIENESKRLWSAIVTVVNGAVVMDKVQLHSQPPAVKRHLLRMAIETISGTIKDIETRHIEDMMAVLDKPAGREIDLPDGLVFSVEYDRCLLRQGPASLSPFPEIKGEALIKIPGETTSSGWRVNADLLTGEALKKVNIHDSATPGDATGPVFPAEFHAYFDYDRIGDNLKFRPTQPGDRFQPLGLKQSKKVARFMIDARIPRTWRHRIPVVVSDRRIIWLVGWRIDENARVTEKTEQILRLTFSQHSDK